MPSAVHFGDQLIGDAGRQRLINQRAFALGRFHSIPHLFRCYSRSRIPSITRTGTPADAAVTFVQQGEIIVHSRPRTGCRSQHKARSDSSNHGNHEFRQCRALLPSWAPAPWLQVSFFIGVVSSLGWSDVAVRALSAPLLSNVRPAASAGTATVSVFLSLRATSCASPCGSRIRNDHDQRTDDHQLQMRDHIGGPAQAGRRRCSSGQHRQQHQETPLPAKLPKIDPSPPMMIMNSTRNDFWMPKTSPTSTAPR